MTPMLYSARLESQTDEQWRRRTVLADSAGEARKLMERREDNRAAYSITARRSLRQIETRRHADGVHALVNLDPFATPEGAAEVSGRELLSFLEQDYHVEGNGKVYGPRQNVKAHLQAHYQSEPYKIVSLEPVVPNARELINGLAQLHRNDKAWKKALDAMREAGIHLRRRRPHARVQGVDLRHRHRSGPARWGRLLGDRHDHYGAPSGGLE
jgi:hypothetical protein